MRAEFVDAVEILRRIELGIYDNDEFQKAMKWTRENCMSREGEDYNPEHLKKTREQKDKDWEFVVKMTMIMRDLMIGNPVLDKMGLVKKP
jgi:L-fucose isomerase